MFGRLEAIIYYNAGTVPWTVSKLS